MEYNAMTYPEGYNKVIQEELSFLPEDRQVREGFLDGLMQFLLMM